QKLKPPRDRLGVPAPRPCALARLSLERRWPRGHLRSAPADLLRAGALEWPRSDLEGAVVRTHGQRGKPWRGREGVLLLPRLHADALVHAVSLQVPACRVSLRRAGRGEPPAR